MLLILGWVEHSRENERYLYKETIKSRSPPWHSFHVLYKSLYDAVDNTCLLNCRLPTRSLFDMARYIRQSIQNRILAINCQFLLRISYLFHNCTSFWHCRISCKKGHIQFASWSHRRMIPACWRLETWQLQVSTSRLRNVLKPFAVPNGFLWRMTTFCLKDLLECKKLVEAFRKYINNLTISFSSSYLLRSIPNKMYTPFRRVLYSVFHCHLF